jgi:hypothetical protein
MGKRFLRSIVQDQVNVTGPGDITPRDLPVNPLSFLVLTIWLEEIASLAVSSGTFMAKCFTAISDLSIRHKGEQIIQGSLADLTMLAAALTGYKPWGTNLTGQAARASMNFVIPFTRKPYWHNEAFPATTRGNLRFHMTVADETPGDATALDFGIEACELIEDEPEQYLKYTTNTRTPAATGRQRMPLPLGNEILKVLLFDGLTEITTTEAFTWGKVKVLKDNVEQYYVESNAEALRADISRAMGGNVEAFGHQHGSDGTAAVVGQQVYPLNQPPNQYHLLDFDPLDDGSYALETAGASTLDLDANVDSIAGTPVMRYLPVELIKIR